MTKVSATIIIASILVALASTSVKAFSSPTSHSRIVSRATLSSSLASSKPDDDFPKEDKEEYSGSVDWDAEWKKVMEKEKAGQKMERPGSDFYKSDAELAAIRAANKAQAEVQKISQKLPSAPSFNMGSLTGDWRFWIGILALISIGSAVLTAQPSYTPVSNGDSYYI